MIIEKRAYARLGLMGNPSDGFFGKTISCTIENFHAKVELWESPMLALVPHPLYDPVEFKSLPALYQRAQQEGYYGGLRLLMATCKRFYEHCLQQGIPLERRNFTVRYDTNIPRQVGLAGSSAIITATFKALMEFYGLTEREIPKPIQPNLILSVERDELGISAGLQDRVIQVYEGLVYMDFNRELMEGQGYGRYEPMDPALVPPLWLAYISKFGDSGRVHSTIRFRWERGDPEVVEAMRTFARYAEEGREALEQRDHRRFSDLMNRSFDLRRRIYGDAVIGEPCLRMVELARSLGSPASFPGSGGAVIGIYWSEEHLRRLQEAFEAEGFSFCRVAVHTPA